MRVTSRPLLNSGKAQYIIVHEAGWVNGPVWTGAENLVHTGIRFPDRPARSQLLYRLPYLVCFYMYIYIFTPTVVHKYEVCLKSKCTDFLFKCLLDSPEITSDLLQSMTLGKLHNGSNVFSTDHSNTGSHFLYVCLAHRLQLFVCFLSSRNDDP